ncbi:MATE family efflux transporter [Kordiimonas aquimaris]|uniref:MATE family efflux transporter n=1 Tax=Kordiimonas aquimaris TaxID=707591 RepID=UPI0021CFCC5A|nr:MATE family efflux transporter [Kordiimonas aquimaris]
MGDFKMDEELPVATKNPYLSGAIPRLYVKMATPIIVIMLVNGLFTVVDALFLGIFVGADALTAVTLMFPMFMLIIALSTLVGNGMASVIARQLGADDIDGANQTLMSAHVLSVVMSGLLIILFLLFGNALILSLANQDIVLAQMGHDYIALLIYFSPITFMLGLQSDSLRSEGKNQFLAGIAVGSTLLNVALNYLLIAVLEYGVFGSALGTILAQGISSVVVVWARLSGFTRLKLLAKLANITTSWREMIALGIPSSLNFIGVSVMSAVIISVLQIFAGDAYATTVAAYGIITRVFTFVYLPLLGFNLAAQSIVGNNMGAKMYGRSNSALKIALLAAFVYSAVMQLILFVAAEPIGALFTEDTMVIAEVGRILPIFTLMLVAFAQLLILAGYFQACGDAKRAAIFGLGKTYLFTIPLTLILPHFMAEPGIWYASPLSEVAMVCVAIFVLVVNARRTGAAYGLFIKP